MKKVLNTISKGIKDGYDLLTLGEGMSDSIKTSRLNYFRPDRVKAEVIKHRIAYGTYSLIQLASGSSAGVMITEFQTLTTDTTKIVGTLASAYLPALFLFFFHEAKEDANEIMKKELHIEPKREKQLQESHES